MLIWAFCACPRVAEGQNRAPVAGNRAVFGADGRDPERSRKADVSMSLTVTDDNRNRLVSRLQGEMLDSWMLRNGRYPALDGTLHYARKTKRFAFDADTTSTIQYSSQLREPMTDHSGGIAVRVPAGRRTEFSGSQRILYAPRYRLPMASELMVNRPVPALSNTPAAASQALGAHSSTSNVRVSHRVDSRSTAAFSYDLQSVHFAGAETDLLTWGAGGRFTRRVSRYAALRLGYARRVGRYGRAPEQSIRIHDLDLGLDYNRTMTRSMSLTITPGSSLVVTSQGKRYRPSGEIAVSRRFGRSWMGRMRYRRSSEFIEGFEDPFFVDVATAAVAGYVRRGLEVGASASYSTSEIGSLGTTYFDSLSGSAQATLAINHRWAVFAEYLDHDQRMEGAMAVSATSPLNRHSMRAGLKWRKSLW